jgi:flagellar biosynthesis/type III secretory pathway protein FliH
MSIQSLNRTSERVAAAFEGRIDAFLNRFMKSTASILQPIEIEKRLIKAIDENTKVFFRQVMPPNKAVIHLSTEDFKDVSKYLSTLMKELAKTAEEYIAKNLQLKGHRVSISIIEDDELSPRRIRCEAEFVESEDLQKEGK